MENINNEPIQGIIVQENLPPQKAELLVNEFSGFFTEAKNIVNEGKQIIVTDIDDNSTMLKARELRLKLKNIRTSLETTRKNLKEQSLREGRAIDGVANVLKALIVPVEEHLEAQENYKKVQEELQRQKILAERKSKLFAVLDSEEAVNNYSVEAMTDGGFDELLSALRQAKKARLEAEEQARLEAIKAEQEILAERERIRKENEALKAEAQKRQAEYEKAEAEKARELKAKEAELANERAEKEKLAQAEADRRRKEQEEAERLKAIEAEKALAPDREKMLLFAIELTQTNLPAVSTTKARKIVSEIENELGEIAERIRAEFR